MSLATNFPILCYITDRKAWGAGAGIPDLLASIRRAIYAGVDWIQIREKDLSGRDLLDLARQAVTAAAGTSTRILINDRLDVAIAAEAGGAHLGGESLPVAEVVRWRNSRFSNADSKEIDGGNFFVGASCHDLSAATDAERAGADYIIFGPIFETPSKAAFGPPQGLARLHEVCSRVAIPVLAIGGINQQVAPDCLGAGAAGIAAIRFFQKMSDQEKLRAAVTRIRQR